MAKDYNTFSDVSTGDVYTAAAHNLILENVENYRVPPIAIAYRSSDLTSYSQGSKITWQAAVPDTDSMWDSATKLVAATAGLYQVTFTGYVTATPTVTFFEPNIFVNGTRALSQTVNNVGLGGGGTFTITGVVSLAAADYLEASIGIAGGSAYVVNGNSLPNFDATRLMATWLGQVS